MIISIFGYIIILWFWNIFLEFYWVLILISSIGIISIILGGIKLKYDKSSWIVIIGVILIFVSLILAILTATTIIDVSFSVIAIGFIFTGIALVVGGALVSDKKSKE